MQQHQHPLSLQTSNRETINNREQTQKSEQFLKMLDSCNKKLENTKSSHEIELGELKALIAGFSYQQTSIL